MLCREMQTCQALLTSAQHVVHLTERSTSLTHFGGWPGEMYCLAEAGHVSLLHCLWSVCQGPLRLLCQDRCWCSLYSRCSFLHGNRATAEPVAMPKPLCRHLYQQVKVQLYFLHRDWDTYRLVQPWLNCSFTASRLPLGEPDVRYLENLCPQASTVAKMPRKVVFQALNKEVDKEVVGLFCLEVF